MSYELIFKRAPRVVSILDTGFKYHITYFSWKKKDFISSLQFELNLDALPIDQYHCIGLSVLLISKSN